MKTKAPKLVAFAVSLLAVVVLSTGVLWNNITRTAFHGDESGWVSVGYHYANLLFERDFSREDWDCRSCAQWGSLNPHLGKLLIGIPLELHRRSSVGEGAFFNLYDFSKTLQANEREGRVPSPHLLHFARAVSLVFGVLSLAVAFSIMYVTVDVWTALILVIVLLVNPIFVEYATRAMTDVHYNFFMLCFLAMSTWFLARTHGLVSASAAAGACAGLACSVKVTGLVITGVTFAGLVVYGLVLGRYRIKRAFFYSVTFLFVAIGVAFVLNPVYWPSFADIEGAVVVNELKALLWMIAEQPEAWDWASVSKALLRAPFWVILQQPSTDLPVSFFSGPLTDHYPQLGNILRPLEFPRMFGRWNWLMDRQMDVGRWQTDNHLVEMHRTLIELLAASRWLLLPCLVGALFCLARIRSSLRRRRADLLVVPFNFFMMNYLFLVIFLKLNWDRYYVPTVIAGSFLVAIGFGQLLRHVTGRAARRLSQC